MNAAYDNCIYSQNTILMNPFTWNLLKLRLIPKTNFQSKNIKSKVKIIAMPIINTCRTCYLRKISLQADIKIILCTLKIYIRIVYGIS